MQETKSFTVEAIKRKHKYLTKWCKDHGYGSSLVNDMLHRRAGYIEMDTPSTWSKAYRVLQDLIKEGHGEALAHDGWDPKLIDLDFEVPVIERKTAVTDLESICWDVCELGDEYTCNIFMSPVPDAGPVAVLFMMEKSTKATRHACTLLNSTRPGFEFYMESAALISIWAQ
jgi:hypothetical protein